MQFKQTKVEPRATPTDPRRTLVGEILVTQLGYALLIGVVALASVWSGANWIIRENMTELAQRWIEDLDNLGVGLYSDVDSQRYLRIEGYVAKFPEIAYVRYYDPDGQVVFLESGSGGMPEAPILRVDELNQMREMVDNEERHLEQTFEQALVRLSAAIQVASITSEGLLEAVSLSDVETEKEIVGFVELGLDYSRYDAQLWRHTTNASGAVALAFLLLALIGRILLRRALQPLSDIQRPLAKLAEGETDIEIKRSPHREIAAISDGLSNAVSRIRERDAHLRFLAEHDDLTRLPNRYWFMNKLKELMNSGSDTRGTVFLVDLDQFKYVNDTLGHIAGDAILNQVAARIKSTVGNTGHTARFGGDEFGVVTVDEHADESERLALRIMNALAEFPFVYDSHSFSLTCSIGISTVDGRQTSQVDQVLACADMACQQAKLDGRNRVRLYEPDAGTVDSIKHDIGWSQKLKKALKNDDFVLHFQPIASIETGLVCHYEVLLRLKDDDGLHSPGAFISAAERFGLMHEIDRWVIERGFRALAWFRRNDPDLRFTINVSGGSFAEGDLVGFVKRQFEMNELEPSAIIFEITEQVAVGSIFDAAAQIGELIELGCEFALDDFGAGYSSFNYLKKLPMQYVKIDGQFVQELHKSEVDQALVRAIAEVAKTLGKKTIAEYVENEESLGLLAKFGIDYVQGFFIGKPQERLLDSGMPVNLKRAPKG